MEYAMAKRYSLKIISQKGEICFEKKWKIAAPVQSWHCGG
jgi:endonuclease I